MSTVAPRTQASRAQPFRTLDGSTVALDRAEIGAALGGNVLFPDSAGYADARAIWNAMIERQPAAIVRAANERDVINAVTFARAKRLLLAVKGGGHNIAGSALVEGGLVIDLSPMRKITVDTAARVARVEPGVTLADVDGATQQHGLIVPTGINSTTGIAGLTLGGGFGWTTRKLGLTID
ncbi:MAG TPA: FAD-dependent oxidoreductase, partial [Gemmatimonadaceae bacterium]|nr:FAD-dependent oxidoreductase [Gemmatimonadaceae bacterium]